MPKARIHVSFDSSAGENLRIAFNKLALNEHVVVFPDNLSYGPINTVDIDVRVDWLVNTFHADRNEWSSLPEDTIHFWDYVDRTDRDIVFWCSRNVVYDHCGYLACLQRLRSDSIFVLDLMDIDFSQFGVSESHKWNLSHSLGLLNADLTQALVGKDVLVPLTLRKKLITVWDKLVAENAPLRAIGEQGVVSVSLSFYDNILRSCIDYKWRSILYVIGDAMYEANCDKFFNASPIVLKARIFDLIDEGTFEIRGDPSDLRHSEIRLRKTKIASVIKVQNC